MMGPVETEKAGFADPSQPVHTCTHSGKLLSHFTLFATYFATFGQEAVIHLTSTTSLLTPRPLTAHQISFAINHSDFLMTNDGMTPAFRWPVPLFFFLFHTTFFFSVANFFFSHFFAAPIFFSSLSPFTSLRRI